MRRHLVVATATLLLGLAPLASAAGRSPVPTTTTLSEEIVGSPCGANARHTLTLLTAKVSVATGTVTFSDFGHSLGAARLAHGVAQLAVQLPGSQARLTAHYNGAPGFLPSTSTPLDIANAVACPSGVVPPLAPASLPRTGASTEALAVLGVVLVLGGTIAVRRSSRHTHAQDARL